MSKLNTRILVLWAALLAALVLVSALVIPALAASPKGGPSKPAGDQPGQSGTRIQGTAAGSLLLTNLNGDNVTLSWPSGTVSVDYTVSGSVLTLKSLSQIRTPPDHGAIPLAGSGTRIQGTVSGSLTVTPSSGPALTLNLPADRVEVVLSVVAGDNVLNCLKTIGMPPTPAPVPDTDNCTEARGIATGSFTFTPAGGTAVTLNLPEDTVEVAYNTSGTTSTLRSLKLLGIQITPGAGKQSKTDSRLLGSAAGTFTFTPTGGSALSLALPSSNVEVIYSTVNGANVLSDLKPAAPGQSRK